MQASWETVKKSLVDDLGSFYKKLKDCSFDSEGPEHRDQLLVCGKAIKNAHDLSALLEAFKPAYMWLRDYVEVRTEYNSNGRAAEVRKTFLSKLAESNVLPLHEAYKYSVLLALDWYESQIKAKPQSTKFDASSVGELIVEIKTVFNSTAKTDPKEIVLEWNRAIAEMLAIRCPKGLAAVHENTLISDVQKAFEATQQWSEWTKAKFSGFTAGASKLVDKFRSGSPSPLSRAKSPSSSPVTTVPGQSPKVQTKEVSAAQAALEEAAANMMAVVQAMENNDAAQKALQAECDALRVAIDKSRSQEASVRQKMAESLDRKSIQQGVLAAVGKALIEIQGELETTGRQYAVVEANVAESGELLREKEALIRQKTEARAKLNAACLKTVEAIRATRGERAKNQNQTEIEISEGKISAHQKQIEKLREEDLAQAEQLLPEVQRNWEAATANLDRCTRELAEAERVVAVQAQEKQALEHQLEEASLSASSRYERAVILREAQTQLGREQASNKKILRNVRQTIGELTVELEKAQKLAQIRAEIRDQRAVIEEIQTQKEGFDRELERLEERFQFLETEKTRARESVVAAEKNLADQMALVKSQRERKQELEEALRRKQEEILAKDAEAGQAQGVINNYRDVVSPAEKAEIIQCFRVALKHQVETFAQAIDVSSKAVNRFQQSLPHFVSKEKKKEIPAKRARIKIELLPISESDTPQAIALLAEKLTQEWWESIPVIGFLIAYFNLLGLLTRRNDRKNNAQRFLGAVDLFYKLEGQQGESTFDAVDTVRKKLVTDAGINRDELNKVLAVTAPYQAKAGFTEAQRTILEFEKLQNQEGPIEQEIQALKKEETAVGDRERELEEQRKLFAATETKQEEITREKESKKAAQEALSDATAKAKLADLQEEAQQLGQGLKTQNELSGAIELHRESEREYVAKETALADEAAKNAQELETMRQIDQESAAAEEIKTKTLSELDSSLVESNTKKRQLGVAVSVATEKLAELAHQKESLEKYISGLGAKIQEQDRELKDEEAKLKGLRVKLAEKQRVLGERHARRIQELQVMDDEIQRLKAEKGSLEVKLSGERQEQARLVTQQTSLVGQREELERTRREAEQKMGLEELIVSNAQSALDSVPRMQETLRQKTEKCVALGTEQRELRERHESWAGTVSRLTEKRDEALRKQQVLQTAADEVSRLSTVTFK